MNYFTFNELKINDYVFILDENEPINYKTAKIESIEDDGYKVEYHIEDYGDLFFFKDDVTLNESMSHEWYDGSDRMIFSDICSLMEYIQNKVNSYNKLLTDLKS